MARRKPAAADLFTFALDGPRTPYNLSSGWERRKRELARGASPDFGEFDQFVLAEAKRAARRREVMTGYPWSIDHLIPLRRGGLHAWHNIQVIPARLNSWKSDKLLLTIPGEWVDYLPGARRHLFEATS